MTREWTHLRRALGRRCGMGLGRRLGAVLWPGMAAVLYFCLRVDWRWHRWRVEVVMMGLGHIFDWTTMIWSETTLLSFGARVTTDIPRALAPHCFSFLDFQI